MTGTTTRSIGNPDSPEILDSAPAAPEVPGPEVGSPKRRSLASRLFFPLAFAALAAWGVTIALGDKVTPAPFDPATEFDLSDPVIGPDGWGIGWLDLTINKGVIYLGIALLGSIAFALYTKRAIARRVRQETKTQTLVEGVYEFAHDQIAAMLGQRVFSRYMPYVASLFIFIWFVNMSSFVPLPLNTHHELFGVLPSLGIYAVSSNIFATITLALVTFLAYHYEGVRAHGFVGYLKTWTAGQSGLAGAFVFFVEALTNLVLKPISLGVRLFANLLSGHVLILLMLSLAGIVAGGVVVSVLAQAGGLAIATAFYLFEMGLIVTLQSFIFAVLSAIYIGAAAEEHH